MWAAGLRYDEDRNFELGAQGWRGQLPQSSFFVNMSGSCPCCIDSVVPQSNGDNLTASGTALIGRVLGVCNISTGSASITWLGAEYKQSIDKAQLLTMHIFARPGTLFQVERLYADSAAVMAVLVHR